MHTKQVKAGQVKPVGVASGCTANGYQTYIQPLKFAGFGMLPSARAEGLGLTEVLYRAMSMKTIF